jgi:hypothetical protein
MEGKGPVNKSSLAHYIGGRTALNTIYCQYEGGLGEVQYNGLIIAELTLQI